MTIQRLQSATESLSKLDISGLVTSMALGIAEAQRQLDENSISQTLILADSNLGINGQSLLELGFVPTFYAFQYVDISANMSLKVSSDFSIDVGLTLDIGVGGDKSKASSSDILKSEEDTETRREFTSSRSVVISNTSEESLLVGESQTTVKMDSSKGCYTRRHKLANDLRQDSQVERVESEVIRENVSVDNQSSNDVRVNYIDGYLTIALEPHRADGYAIFKIGDDNDTTSAEIIPSGATFSVDNDFEESVANVVEEVSVAGTVYGFSGNNFYEHDGSGTFTAAEVSETELRFHFGFDKDDVDPDLVVGAYDNQVMMDRMKEIALIIENDPNQTVDVVGHTDSSGPDNYNKGLALRRANAVRDMIIKFLHKSDHSRVVAKQLSEQEALAGGPDDEKNPVYRKVVVALLEPCDYIYMEGGNLDVSSTLAVSSSSGENEYIKEHAAAGGAIAVDANVGDPDGEIGLDFSSLSTSIDNTFSSDAAAEFSSDSYSGAEIFHDVLHFMKEKLRIKYNAYSESSEEITITKSSESSTSTTDSVTETDSLVIGDSFNQSTYSQIDSDSLKSDKVWSLDASLDARVASRFSFSIDGNSSMSARMVALPAPEAFLDLVRANTGANA